MIVVRSFTLSPASLSDQALKDLARAAAQGWAKNKSPMLSSIYLEMIEDFSSFVEKGREGSDGDSGEVQLPTYAEYSAKYYKEKLRKFNRGKVTSMNFWKATGIMYASLKEHITPRESTPVRPDNPSRFVPSQPIRSGDSVTIPVKTPFRTSPLKSRILQELLVRSFVDGIVRTMQQTTSTNEPIFRLIALETGVQNGVAPNGRRFRIKARPAANYFALHYHKKLREALTK